MKPVCTGPRDDVRLLQSLQRGCLNMNEMNPFHYAIPAAPIVAARNSRKKVKVQSLLRLVSRMEKQCDQLLVEGAGGILVPLNKHRETWADFLRAAKMPVLVSAKNELGVLNHTLLTVQYLQQIGVQVLGLCLHSAINSAMLDASQRTNLTVLRDCLGETPVFEIPFLGKNAGKTELIERGQKKVKKTLAEILDLV